MAPVTVITVYALLGRMAYDHAAIAILTIFIGISVFIQPFLSNIHALTEYVRQLAQDKAAEAPDLSFLNNVEELSTAVAELNSSWERRKNQLEAALAENKIVIEVLPDALFIMDDNQRIVRTNGMARHMFGHRLTGKTMQEVIPIDELSTAIKNVTQMNEIEFNLEGEISRDYIGKVTKFPANSPSHTDTILSLHDLTELKRIRRMRADFVANASHEMKTPLASIIGLIETLQTSAKEDPKARKQFLAIMAEQADRMKRLIADLLSLSKIEAETNLPSADVDVGKTVLEAKRYSEWFAEQKKVEVNISIDAALPHIAGDEDQLIQVFTNLITNSIKYGHAESEVKVNVAVTRKLPVELNDRFDKAVAVTIEDKSEGIPQEHIARLTERFYRVDAGRTRKLGGTGLGLAIVKHVLNRHNGVLKIESEIGVGSKFSVFLPLPDSYLAENIETKDEGADEET